MSLLAQQKAERRTRILAAARELIAERGYDRLTMRRLARASRVSVATLYNLFGSKHAILAAEFESTFAAVAASLSVDDDGSGFAPAVAAIEATHRELLDVPGYYRELIHVVSVAPETQGLWDNVTRLYVEMLAGHLRSAQGNNLIADWVDADALAHQLFAHFTGVIVAWATGRLDGEGFRATSIFGMCTILLGVAQGAGADELRTRARAVQAQAYGNGPTHSIAANHADLPSTWAGGRGK